MAKTFRADERDLSLKHFFMLLLVTSTLLTWTSLLTSNAHLKHLALVLKLLWLLQNISHHILCTQGCTE